MAIYEQLVCRYVHCGILNVIKMNPLPRPLTSRLVKELCVQIKNLISLFNAHQSLIRKIISLFHQAAECEICRSCKKVTVGDFAKWSRSGGCWVVSGAGLESGGRVNPGSGSDKTRAVAPGTSTFEAPAPNCHQLTFELRNEKRPRRTAAAE